MGAPAVCPLHTSNGAEIQQDPTELDDMTIQQLGLTDEQYNVFSEMQLARFSTIIHCRKYVHFVVRKRPERPAHGSSAGA